MALAGPLDRFLRLLSASPHLLLVASMQAAQQRLCNLDGCHLFFTGTISDTFALLRLPDDCNLGWVK